MPKNVHVKTRKSRVESRFEVKNGKARLEDKRKRGMYPQKNDDKVNASRERYITMIAVYY